MVLLTVVVVLSLFNRPASANPISTPFDYALEIALFNFPINGFLLLPLYFALVRRGATATYFGQRNFFILFLACTSIISFTGAIVDSVAYTTLSIPVFLVATVLIGMIAGTVVHRYLRLDLEASWVVVVVFFVVNLVSWNLLASGSIIMIAWDYSIALWVLMLAYLVTLGILTREHQGRVEARRYMAATDPRQLQQFPGDASAYPVKVPSPFRRNVNTGIVIEASVMATSCLFLLIFLYSMWLY